MRLSFSACKKEREERRRLEAELERLREELAFLKRQNERMAADCGRALKENSVLRFELAQCQRDRQVLEMQISGARAEMEAALNLLSLYQTRPPGKNAAEAALRFAEEARRLGVEGPWDALRAAARALGADLPSWDAEAWKRERALAVLRLAERELSERLRNAERAASALGEARGALALIQQLRLLAGVA